MCRRFLCLVEKGKMFTLRIGEVIHGFFIVYSRMGTNLERRGKWIGTADMYNGGE